MKTWEKLSLIIFVMRDNPLLDKLSGMDAGVLKVIKRSDTFEFTNPGILKLPLDDIYRGGNSKSRNPHMQTMLRLVGFGDNVLRKKFKKN